MDGRSFDYADWPTWRAFDLALEEFNRKNRVDWTVRELQSNTAYDIATRAFELESQLGCNTYSGHGDYGHI